MKKILKIFLCMLCWFVASAHANVWKCPNDPNDYGTREEARAVCCDDVYYPRESSWSEEDPSFSSDKGIESEPQLKSQSQIPHCGC